MIFFHFYKLLTNLNQFLIYGVLGFWGFGREGSVRQSHAACPRIALGFFPDPPFLTSLSLLFPFSSSLYFAHSSQECLKFSQLKATAVAVAPLVPFKMKHLPLSSIQRCQVTKNSITSELKRDHIYQLSKGNTLRSLQILHTSPHK